MPDGTPLRRRTLLKGGALAALGSVSQRKNAQVSRTIQYYANERGYIDANGLLDAVSDWRAGTIGSDLLFEVASYYRSGEAIVDGDSANPARLIESHINSLENAAFSLDIQEYQDSAIDSPSKVLNFQWDDATQQSQLTESSRQNQEVDVTQLFTQNRQHVDIQENNTQINQATLPIDKGPVYIDGQELLDQLLIGASLSFDRLVSTGDTTLSRYTIENHRRLPEASGHVIGDEGSYISELEVQWRRPNGRLTEIDIYTDTSASQSLDSLQSFEPNINFTPSSGETISTTTDHGSVSIADVVPSTAETLTGGSTETFDLTIDYDMGGASPGELKISVREESWGDIDKTVSVDQQSGPIDISISEQIESSWDQAKLIVNLYDADGFAAIDGDELSYAIDSSSGGGTTQLPDLEVANFEWSPRNPTPSDDIEFRVEIENTGNFRAESIEPRVFVDGELAYVPPTLDLDPGEREWAVKTGYKSFDAGEYTARAVVDPDGHIDEQDETNNELERSLRVEAAEESISAELADIQVASGEYSTDELVTTDATVKNTGNVAHTFFVGYDVVGPAGEHYNNNAQTGRAVYLDPGENTTISLDWAVQESAPDGQYDVVISVWKESDRYSLTTRLDSSTEYNSFTVSTIDPQPDLSVESLDWTPQLPEQSATVTFEAAIRNIGNGRADRFTLELAIDGQRVDSKSISGLASSRSQTVTFDAWTATGSSSVTVTVDPSDETRDESGSNNTLTRQVSVSQPDPQISITGIQAGNSTYAPEDIATTTTNLTNTGDSSREVAVSQELRDTNGKVLSTTNAKTIGAGDSVNATSQWGLSGSLTTGQYDLTVRVTVDSEVVAETIQPSVFEVTESTGPVDVDIETVAAQGNSVDGAQIILTPLDGGSDISTVSNGGLAQFNSIRPGKYELTAKSTQLNQELTFGLVVDGASNLTRRIVFRPTDAIYGTVFNGAGQQHIPEATISIPELQETAETDAKGEFVLVSDIPDGTYEFEITVTPDNTVIADSEASTFNKTRDVDIDRTVTFDIPVDIQQPENSSSELISEEDRLVSIVVRNLEKRDVLLPLEQQFISLYGFVKGIITGIQGFLEEIWGLLTNLDDIPEMISAIIKMINLILDNPSVIFKMISMMINDIIEKQEQDNPFEEGTIDYHSFFAAWMLGYGGIKIVISVIGTKGATSASKFVKSSSKISNAVDSLKGKVSDGDLPDYSPINRRIRPCSVTSTQAISANTSNCLEIENLRVVENILSDRDDLFREVLKTVGEIRRFGNNNTVANLFDEGGSLANLPETKIRGTLGEYLWAYQFQDNLPRDFFEDFGQNVTPDIVKRLDTDENGDPTLPAGDARILVPDKYDGDEIDLELDTILVGRVPRGRPNAGELQIYDISEVKVGFGDTAEDALDQLERNLNRIQTALDNKGNALTGDKDYAGIPMSNFNNIIKNDRTRTVAQKSRNDKFNDNLQYTYGTLSTIAYDLRGYASAFEVYTR